MESRRYAKLKQDGTLEWAPKAFAEDGGIVVPRSDAEFIARGWLPVVDEKPPYAPATQQCVFLRWEASQSEIAAVYEVRPRPKPQTSFQVSKLYLEIELMKEGLYQAFGQFVDGLTVPISETVSVPARTLYDKALVLDTGNDMFKAALPAAAEALGVSEAKVEKILLAAKAK